VESVKAASDVYAPLAGEVLESNAALSSAPELLNQDPYGKGWLLRLRLADTTALAGLLDASAYSAVLAESA
jgi:glycine cleavage system H protein